MVLTDLIPVFILKISDILFCFGSAISITVVVDCSVTCCVLLNVTCRCHADIPSAGKHIRKRDEETEERKQRWCQRCRRIRFSESKNEWHTTLRE